MAVLPECEYLLWAVSLQLRQQTGKCRSDCDGRAVAASKAHDHLLQIAQRRPVRNPTTQLQHVQRLLIRFPTMPRPVWRSRDLARLYTQATFVSEREDRAQVTNLPLRILRHRQSSHGAALCMRHQCLRLKILLTTVSTTTSTTTLLQSRVPVQSRSLPRHRSHSCRLRVL